jgi:mono/diheme cytochrome c family protein
MTSNNRRNVNAKSSFMAIALVLLAAFAVSSCSTATSSNTWVQPNQNAKNTRYVGGRIHKGSIDLLAVGWTAKQTTAFGFGDGAPSPFVTKNNVFVQGKAGNIVGFDIRTGDLTAGVQSPRIATKLPSWLLGGHGKLKTLHSGISPILTTGDDDKPIAVGASGNRVVALGAESGGKAWSSAIEGIDGTTPRIISNMAAAHEKIYVPVANVPKAVKGESLAQIVEGLKSADSSNGQLVALNSSDGKVAWKKKLHSVPLGAATVVNDLVFTSTLDGHVYAFDADNGDEVWSSELPAGAVAPIAAFDNTLIVPAGFVSKKGQQAQIVAFTIGGLGSVGGAEAPKIAQKKEEATAEKSEAESAEGETAGLDGKTLFVDNCGGCHTLADAGTSGTAGPKLDGIGDDESKVEKQIENGGGAMPPFKGQLSPEEIKAIATYVSSVDGS